MRHTFENFNLTQCNSEWTITEDQRTVKITYGSDDDVESSPWRLAINKAGRTRQYTFDTPAELRAFLLGIDGGVGWMEYRIVALKAQDAEMYAKYQTMDVEMTSYFFLDFPHEEDAKSVLVNAACMLDKMGQDEGHGDMWQGDNGLYAVCLIVPGLDNFPARRANFEALAQAKGGKYDGWACDSTGCNSVVLRNPHYFADDAVGFPDAPIADTGKLSNEAH